MSEELRINVGCNGDYSELCALSTTGSLTSDEYRRLQEHVAVCAQCASLLDDYRSVASEGMAKVGAVQSSGRGEFNQEFLWNRDGAKARLLSSLGVPAHDSTSQPSESGETALPDAGIWGFGTLSRAMPLLGIAALLLLATFVAYQMGLKRGTVHMVAPSSKDAEVAFRQELTEVQAQRASLNEKLVADSKVIETLEERTTRTEKELAQLQAFKASLEAKAQELGVQNQQQSISMTTLSKEHESLLQKLQATEKALQATRQDLIASQEERQKVFLHSADLEAQIDGLSAQLRDREMTSQRQEGYLSSDRDIRELMGARQLYIADVFDIDSQGKTKKPFGRVFYTRGKSLIFYAFDLEQQPAYREAKAFQAWGRQASSQAKPVSLGIFYMDNEANRRWVLKSNDPKILEEINAVFVTVEPKGGSKKPTNKPFLVAYLHTAPPNHP